jgi:hypothetical protein
MAMGDLPEDGELRLGPVSLPTGRRIVVPGDPGEPVVWATTQAVPDAGRTWQTLSDAQARAGLVPVLLRPNNFASVQHSAEIESRKGGDTSPNIGFHVILRLV